MTLTQSWIVLGMSVLLVSARSVGGQQSLDRPPTTFELVATSAGGATGGALIGGLAGLTVDGAYCQRHHGKDPSLFFGPCFLYIGEGSAIGWFGGTLMGATWGAARVAERRGCARKAAIVRSAIGAAIGAAPGIVIVAPRSGKYPASRSVFIAAAPVLSGIGAAVAVGGCHAP